MRPAFLSLIQCPACAGSLVLQHGQEQAIRYHQGVVREVEQGAAACEQCAAVFPIDGYVLSFGERLAPSVHADGAFWGAFYRQHYEQGYRGFMDTTAPPIPFLTQGVTEPLPFEGEEWGGLHVALAEHRWVKPGGRIVDIGVGAGWSSLFLARRGFEVIAFDPALELMQLAKRHALEQGVYLEYICADMANVRLPDASVDAVFAFHSLHHVPDVDQALREIHRILRVGGCLALDDHLQDVGPLLLLRAGLVLEAEAHIFPEYRSPEARLELPASHSENEGVGMGQVLDAVERYLFVDDVQYRHTCFDLLGPLAYLRFGRSQEALHHLSEMAALLHRAMQRTLPDWVEYMTLVAQKREQLPTAPVFGPSPVEQTAVLAERVTALEQEVRRLHGAVADKNAHIQQLEALLERIRMGRVMRILGLLQR